MLVNDVAISLDELLVVDEDAEDAELLSYNPSISETSVLSDDDDDELPPDRPGGGPPGPPGPPPGPPAPPPGPPGPPPGPPGPPPLPKVLLNRLCSSEP